MKEEIKKEIIEFCFEILENGYNIDYSINYLKEKYDLSIVKKIKLETTLRANYNNENYELIEKLIRQNL